MKENGTAIPLNGNSLAKANDECFPKKENLQVVEEMINEQTKIRLISEHFRQILLVLGLDLATDSLKGTPDRVAKMYVKEIFSGLNPANEPDITLFENEYGYG